MKIRVFDPMRAADMMGGCTIEPHIGWWTYAPDEKVHEAAELGVVFDDRRCALYIPTLQKNGEPVPEEAIETLKAKAKELGFVNVSPASGMWILSETGEAQIEYIWIMWTESVSEEVRAQLPELAKWICQYTNQDCVAYELDGHMMFVSIENKRNKNKEEKMKKRIFIVPVNDGEAVEIRNLLLDHGETVVVTRQPWGASWQGLEPEVVEEVEKLLAENPGAQVYGVELAGPARWGAINIDHHRYADDDRWSPKSSLEQVAELLGVELTRYQKLVAENDKGYIPAMEKAGATPDEIKLVRAQDRLAQGVTPDDERQAVIDIKYAERRGRKILLHCPKGSTSAHTDLLYGQYDELLKIDEVSGKWIYFGPRHQQFFALTDGGVAGARWVGGGKKSGYAGAEKPTPETQQKILKFFWEE